MPKNRIHLMKDGRYKYSYTDASGKELTIKSKKDEKKTKFGKRCELIEENAQNITPESDMLFSELFEKWDLEYQSVYCGKFDARVTKDYYKRYTFPRFGHLKLYEIKRSDVYALLSDAAKEGFASGTISILRSTISRPFNWAINSLNLNIQCPTTGLIFRKKRELIEEDDGEIRIISDDDMDRLMLAAENTKYYNYFRVLQYTGLRPSEAVGLKLEDETPKVLCIRRAITIHGEGPLKTKAAKRDIPITPQLRKILQDQRRRLQKGDVWFFPSTDGTPSYNAIDLAFKRTVSQTKQWKKIGRKYHGELLIPAVNFSLYDFRHTFATKMANNNMPYKTLQYIMGHSSISITMRYYVSITEDAKNEAADFMKNVFLKNPGQNPGQTAKLSEN